MGDALRTRLSFANVIALIALFVALGGSSFAAPVRDAARTLITGKQVKKNAITGRHVKDRSLTARDFRGPLPSEPVPGTQGPQGERGPEGPPNPSAVNADMLDQLDSGDFLRTNANAGGDVSGGFSNLQLQANSAGAAELQRAPFARFTGAGSATAPNCGSPQVVSGGGGVSYYPFRAAESEGISVSTLGTCYFGMQITQPGLYQASANVQWPSNATGWRLLRLERQVHINLSSVARDRRTAVNGAPTNQSVSVLVHATPSDVSQGFYLLPYVAQNSGSDLELADISENNFSVIRISD